MRQISFQQKMEVIELYLEGLSTNAIVDKSQISNNPKGRVPWAMPVGECVFARRASSKA